MTKKTHVFIFGIGSGIGEGLYNRFQKEKDPNCFVFGFSRKGKNQLSSFILESPGTYRFDAKDKQTFVQFESLLNGFYGDKPKDSVSILVYFALGDGVFGPISELSDADLQSHLDLNVVSLLKLSRSFSRLLPKCSESTFVFLGSTAGKQGFPESALYCASKHAVLGICRALREEWKPFGSKVVHVSLGAVATEIWDTRPAFDKKDMVSVSDISEYLWCISQLPKSIFVDDLSITPKKGIL
ncbi:MAG: SDR family NAD(P)-dependent oxidoreductase [Leptospira sp.]|uniref:SDR family oxidoreductase n=1 Tax=Leptospira sp. TaxID=178 RepID=UPI0025B8EFC8|nr:SDR family NAD(P)-dependent oxidoreductase [Leptospira sp.]MBL0954085.1 SDR family NAD(P)-dependent oxidoreductase [Leptospira sp.]